MTIGHIRIGKTNLTFVFRHKFERFDDKVDEFRREMDFRNWEIGLWYRHSKIVGKKKFKIPNEWNNNLVRSHQIGFSFLVCKGWVEFNKGGMRIPL